MSCPHLVEEAREVLLVAYDDDDDDDGVLIPSTGAIVCSCGVWRREVEEGKIYVLTY